MNEQLSEAVEPVKEKRKRRKSRAAIQNDETADTETKPSEEEVCTVTEAPIEDDVSKSINEQLSEVVEPVKEKKKKRKSRAAIQNDETAGTETKSSEEEVCTVTEATIEDDVSKSINEQ